ncbi:hypothetical protein D3C86_1970820 [compost metagenome]
MRHGEHIPIRLSLIGMDGALTPGEHARCVAIFELSQTVNRLANAEHTVYFEVALDIPLQLTNEVSQEAVMLGILNENDKMYHCRVTHRIERIDVVPFLRGLPTQHLKS